MTFPTLTIFAEKASRRSRRYGDAGRAFSVTLLAAIGWKKSYKDPLRPLLLDFCGTDAEVRAFSANLCIGKEASRGGRDNPGDRIECLRSEPYKFSKPQSCVAGVRQVVHLAPQTDLVGRVDDEVRLLVAPPASMLSSIPRHDVDGAAAVWASLRRRHGEAVAAVEAERRRIAEVEADRESWRRSRVEDPRALPDVDAADLAEWAVAAREVCVRLDSRTRYPLPPDPAFRAALLRGLTARGCVRSSRGGVADKLSTRYGVGELTVEGDLAGAGYSTAIGVIVDQKTLGEIVAETAREWC